MGRRLAIGDIHGCLHTLRDLIEMVDLQHDDELIFLGDYCDRGPHSKGVIDELIMLSKIYNCTFIRGNHEQMFLDFIDCQDVLQRQMFLQNGGWETLASYRDKEDGVEYVKLGFSAAEVYFPKEHLIFMAHTEGLVIKDDFIFVHAGLNPSLPLGEQYPDYPSGYMWIRNEWESFTGNNWDGKTVVYGHTPKMMPLMWDDRICLDTGCIFDGEYGTGGYLTCCDIDSRNIWMAKKSKLDRYKVRIECEL